MLKVKLKESALVNSLFSQINRLKCKWIYTIVKSKNCECSVRQRNYLEISLLGTGLEIIVWSSKRSISLVVLIILLISTLCLFC